MSDHVYKSVEITGSSSEGVTEAIDRAIAKASETLRHLDWFEVLNIRGHIADGSVAHYQVTLKVGFRLEDEPEAGSAPGYELDSNLNEIARRTRKFTTPPSPIVTSWRTTSAIRRSRTDFAAVSTALRAAASHDSVLTPITSVTR